MHVKIRTGTVVRSKNFSGWSRKGMLTIRVTVLAYAAVAIAGKGIHSVSGTRYCSLLSTGFGLPVEPQDVS